MRLNAGPNNIGKELGAKIKRLKAECYFKLNSYER